jgi:hypothetical protein
MSLRVASTLNNAIDAVDPPHIASQLNRFLSVNSLVIRYDQELTAKSLMPFDLIIYLLLLVKGLKRL